MLILCCTGVLVRIVFSVLIEFAKYKLSHAAMLSYCSPTRYYTIVLYKLIISSSCDKLKYIW